MPWRRREDQRRAATFQPRRGFERGRSGGGGRSRQTCREPVDPGDQLRWTGNATQRQTAQAEIGVLTRWVQRGLPWTPGAAAAEDKPREAPPTVDDEARNYWAYRALQVPDLPPVRNKAWVRNPIDAFVLSKLEAEGLTPAPPAAR